MGRAYGDNNRSSALRLRRRHNPSDTGMACGRNEPWQCCGVYDYRSRNKNHKSRRAQNRIRHQTLLTLYRFRHAFFVHHRSDSKHICVTVCYHPFSSFHSIRTSFLMSRQAMLLNPTLILMQSYRVRAGFFAFFCKTPFLKVFTRMKMI